jgi:lycopene epsilon-cyclase
LQASKPEVGQRDISSYLQPHAQDAGTVDVCVVGGGPAGLALAAEVSSLGRSVCVVAPESKFTNNYGVWVDEFRALGLEHLLDRVWDDSVCYFLDEKVSFLTVISFGRGLGGVGWGRQKARGGQNALQDVHV